MTSRIYIAGPMTGFQEFNAPAFHRAAEVLRAAGHHVENPADNQCKEDRPWEYYMRLGIRQLALCDTICLLPGWEKSKGARMEADIAWKLGMRTMFYELVELAWAV